jgi:putative ubiquitin-RnfH superfamily antitoxin RatB of RatAB toxin-antitoxin module
MQVELAWVDDLGTVVSQTLDLPEGATLGEALAGIEAPRLREGATAGRLVAAVFGELRRPGDVLSADDRIELLEGLLVDPKIARQRRVAVRRAQEARRSQEAARVQEGGGKMPGSAGR